MTEELPTSQSSQRGPASTLSIMNRQLNTYKASSRMHGPRGSLWRWAYAVRRLTAVLIALATPAVWACVQLPDFFRVGDREYELSFKIRSNTLLSIYNCEAPKVPWLLMPHTACARGYVGVWEVRDRELFLVDLRETVDEKYRPTTNRFEELFPDHPAGLPARWFTGLLRLNEPQSDGYMPDVHDFIYVKELHLEVAEGVVTSTRVVNNTALVREVRRRAIENVIAFERGDVMGEWLVARTTNTVDLLLAGRISGMMELNRAFVVRSTGAVEVAAFPREGEPYEHAMTLSGAELQYVAVLIRYARLLDRPRGMTTTNDSGNWECMVWWKGESNHAFWGPIDEPRIEPLELFMRRMGYQAEVARRLSVGRSDTLLDHCLQPWRFASGGTEQLHKAHLIQVIKATPSWRQGMSGIEELARFMTAEEWCGYVAGYLIDIGREQRDEMVHALWREGKVEGIHVLGRHPSRLSTVLAMAAAGELEECRFELVPAQGQEPHASWSLTPAPIRLSTTRTPLPEAVGPLQFVSVDGKQVFVASPLGEVRVVYLSGIYGHFPTLKRLPKADPLVQRELNLVVEAFLQAHLASQTNLTLRSARVGHFIGGVDGVLYLDGRTMVSVQEQLIAEGLARVHRGSHDDDWALPPTLIEHWVAVEEQAKREGRGFWTSHASAMKRYWDDPQDAEQ